MTLSKRQRRQALKADSLDLLGGEVAMWDPADAAGNHGLTASEIAEVYAELRRQLYNWAVRITPPEEEP